MRAKPSASCTLASRSDFTSLPRRTIPASPVSRMSNSCRARRFDATSFLPVASFFWAPGRRLATASLGAMLYAPTRLIDEMVAHAYDGLPNEACGLIVGHAAENRAVRFEPTTNVA